MRTSTASRLSTLFLAAARKRSDEAGIPREPFVVDLAAEVEKAIRDASVPR